MNDNKRGGLRCIAALLAVIVLAGAVPAGPVFADVGDYGTPPGVSDPNASPPGVSDSDTSPLDGTDPNTPLPDVSDPNTPSLDGTDPNTPPPDVSDPGASSPDGTDPNMPPPDVSDPGASSPDGTDAHTPPPDVSDPDASAPDGTEAATVPFAVVVRGMSKAAGLVVGYTASGAEGELSSVTVDNVTAVSPPHVYQPENDAAQLNFALPAEALSVTLFVRGSYEDGARVDLAREDVGTHPDLNWTYDHSWSYNESLQRYEKVVAVSQMSGDDGYFMIRVQDKGDGEDGGGQTGEGAFLVQVQAQDGAGIAGVAVSVLSGEQEIDTKTTDESGRAAPLLPEGEDADLFTLRFLNIPEAYSPVEDHQLSLAQLRGGVQVILQPAEETAAPGQFTLKISNPDLAGQYPQIVAGIADENGNLLTDGNYRGAFNENGELTLEVPAGDIESRIQLYVEKIPYGFVIDPESQNPVWSGADGRYTTWYTLEYLSDVIFVPVVRAEPFRLAVHIADEQVSGLLPKLFRSISGGNEAGNNDGLAVSVFEAVNGAKGEAAGEPVTTANGGGALITFHDGHPANEKQYYIYVDGVNLTHTLAAYGDKTWERDGASHRLLFTGSELRALEADGLRLQVVRDDDNSRFNFSVNFVDQSKKAYEVGLKIEALDASGNVVETLTECPFPRYLTNE